MLFQTNLMTKFSKLVRIVEFFILGPTYLYLVFFIFPFLAFLSSLLASFQQLMLLIFPLPVFLSFEYAITPQQFPLLCPFIAFVRLLYVDFRQLLVSMLLFLWFLLLLWPWGNSGSLNIFDFHTSDHSMNNKAQFHKIEWLQIRCPR